MVGIRPCHMSAVIVSVRAIICQPVTLSPEVILRVVSLTRVTLKGESEGESEGEGALRSHRSHAYDTVTPGGTKAA